MNEFEEFYLFKHLPIFSPGFVIGFHPLFGNIVGHLTATCRSKAIECFYHQGYRRTPYIRKVPLFTSFEFRGWYSTWKVQYFLLLKESDIWWFTQFMDCALWISIYYRPQTKLWKGNVFTSMCQEFCPWGGGVHPRADPSPPDRHHPSRHPVGRHIPWADTPFQADTPPPAWADTSPPHQTATAADGTHPTECILVSLKKVVGSVLTFR